MHKKKSDGWGYFLALLLWCLPNSSPAAEPSFSTPSPSSSCLDRGIADPASDKDKVWADSPERAQLLEKIRQLGQDAPPIKSVLAIEIGLVGSRRIFNSVWLVETSNGVRSFAVETPDDEKKPASFTENPVDPSRYALLWDELLDLRLWNTPTDGRTVGLRADAPVFYGTFCREGRLHRIRIEQAPLPTWGQDDTFDQARRRHDKKGREFMLRPRDRAIEVIRLIQAF
jgi:hypothetical protein